MTGAAAKQIWEHAVEPARREAAKLRAAEPGADCRFAGMLETLQAVRMALIEAVTLGEDGVLFEITSEYLALEKLTHGGQPT